MQAHYLRTPILRARTLDAMESDVSLIAGVPHCAEVFNRKFHVQDGEAPLRID